MGPRKRKAIVDDDLPAPPVQIHCSGEIRARIEDFTRFVDQIAVESDETKAELQTTKEQVQEISAQLNSALAKNEVQAEAIRNYNLDLQEKDEEISQLEATVETLQTNLAREAAMTKEADAEIIQLSAKVAQLKESNLQLHEQVASMAQENSEFRAVRDLLKSATAQFRDYITLDASASSIPTTTGQVTSIEGLVKIWLNDSHFNGDIWYPFVCPVTKQTTTPLRDLAGIDTWNRVGVALGLPEYPPYHFRYNSLPEDSTEPANWNIYPLSDQLAILSKVALMYHRRDVAGFNRMKVYVKDGHNILLTLYRINHGTYQISLRLTIIDRSSTNHAIEFVSGSGVVAPFQGCNFVPSTVVIH